MNDVNAIGRMIFRSAGMSDLPQLKEMYGRIVKNMEEQGIPIWDDVYPSEFLAEDIEKQRLYVLLDNGETVSAFALCDTNAGENAVQWQESGAKALYIDRLGVDIRYAKRGIGSRMLAKAGELAKASGASYLRLFVVDINEPAISLYRKNGFTKVPGAYEEVFDDGFVLREYGYEIEV